MTYNRQAARHTDTDTPISAQEQNDKPIIIYTSQQPVPKLKNAYCLDIVVVMLVIKKFNVWFVYNLTIYLFFWVSGGEKEFVK